MTIQEDSTNAGGSEAMPCGMMCAGNVVGPNWTNDKKGQQMNDVLVYCYCVRVQYTCMDHSDDSPTSDHRDFPKIIIHFVCPSQTG